MLDSPGTHLTAPKSLPREDANLNFIRGCAALVVMLGHSSALYFSKATATQAQTQKWVLLKAEHQHHMMNTLGLEAVVIFFVLSGFLVGGSAMKGLLRGSWSWKGYLIRRLTRLCVVLWPTLLLVALLDHLGLRLFGLGSIYGGPDGQYVISAGLTSLLSARIFLGNMLFSQTILVPTYGTDIPLWSLANEFWYYIIFPLLIGALLPVKRVAVRLLWLGAAIVLMWFSRNTLPLFPIWIAGALTSQLKPVLSEKTGRTFAWISGILLPVSMITLRRTDLPLFWIFATIAIIACCFIYSSRHLRVPSRTTLYAGFSELISKMSYTLYLVHLPIAVFLCACLDRPWHIWNRSAMHLSIWMASNIAVLGTAYLLYRLFEAHTDDVRRHIVRLIRLS
jgi:peptidoglycan/LPS O-acetylase OafA/YrhL